jgi:hypothetical protein
VNFFSKEYTKVFDIKRCVMERRFLDDPVEEKISDRFATGLQEKICSLTEGTNSPRSVECRLRVTSFTKPVRETSDQAEQGMSPPFEK